MNKIKWEAWTDTPPSRIYELLEVGYVGRHSLFEIRRCLLSSPGESLYLVSGLPGTEERGKSFRKVEAMKEEAQKILNRWLKELRVNE